jgi:signal transduction histidine kinase/CheY-like chemotaxis protein
MLTSHSSSVLATKSSAYLEDSCRCLTLANVLSPPYVTRFTPNTNDRLNFGRTRSAWWVHFAVINQTGEKWYLRLDTLLGDEFDLYLFPSGSPQVGNAMTTARYAKPLDNYRRRAWLLDLPQDETFDVYMRATNGDAILQLPIEFLSTSAMLERSDAEHLRLGSLYVAMLMLAVYQLLMFFNLRETSYLVFAFNILMVMATIHRTNPVFTSLAFLGNTHSYFFTAPALLGDASLLWFSRILLGIKLHLPRMDRLYQALAWFSLALIGVIGAIPGGTVLIVWITAAVFFLNLGVGAVLAQRGNKIATYFFFSYLAALLLQMGNGWALAFNNNRWDTSHDLSIAVANLILMFLVSWIQMLRVSGLREQVQHSEAEHKVKDEFLAMMSHELRTPLHAIVGLGELLRLQPLRGIAADYVERLNRAARYQLQLVGNVLDLAKIGNQSFHLEVQPFRLDIAVHAVIGLLGQQATQKGLELTLANNTDCNNSLAVAVVGDRVRFSQVLVNLLGNAIKYTDYGEVTLAVQVNPAVEAGMVWVHCEVTDTGVGIAADKLEQLFEPFSQIRATGTVRQEGIGLGLAISKQLVEAMGGQLSVDSTVGEGSRFAFEMQLGLVSTEGILPDAQAMTELHLPPGLRVLVVDDSETNRFVGGEMLRNMGAEVEFAPGGEEAVLQLGQQDIDVLLLDINMPGMDGFEVARWVRHYGRNRKLPIIALTAHTLPQIEQAGRAAGMDAFLSKPFEYRELHECICQVLGVDVPDSSPFNGL